MALIRYKQDDSEYAIATGRIYNIKFRESVGDKGKPLATFSIAVGYFRDEFQAIKNIYKNCVCWGGLAEYANWLFENEKHEVLATGTVKSNTYNGEVREQIEVTFIIPQPEIEQAQPSKRKNDEDSFDDINF